MKPSARQPLPAEPSRIHLRIKHPRLDPDEITRTLSMAPEHTLDAKRRTTSAIGESYWIAPLTFSNFEESWGAAGGSEEVSRLKLSSLPTMSDEAALALAVRRLQAHQTFFKRIVDEGGTATLLIEVDKTDSLTIPPALARKLGDLGLALELDWSDGAE